eukprot:CAMPEP_0194513098 /NCGR_PEP_ID=MMETSP0253-20130528/45284_1 /TAXON_ID=2966 /ORGANISM="Noctiluca scintillans" /LENGTH=147 /DNA_ID=CAMNT_0039356619 /DNA_START=47 /DNA_END=490 /DNA_ORIENTATION=-
MMRGVRLVRVAAGAQCRVLPIQSHPGVLRQPARSVLLRSTFRGAADVAGRAPTPVDQTLQESVKENEHFSFPKKMEYDAQVKADDAARETLSGGSHSHDGSIEEEVDDVGLTVDHEDGIPEEVGNVYKGPEPTRFGDWSHKCRATDF